MAWTVPDAYRNTAFSAVATGGGGSYSMLLTASGKIVVLSDPRNPVTKIPAALVGGRVVSITAGWNSAGAVTADGRAMVWPSLRQQPADLTNIKKLAIANWAVALRNDGTVTAWGYSPFGETDIPAGLDHVADIAVGSEATFALKDDGTVVAWGGRNNGHELDLPPVLTDTTDDLDVTAITTARGQGALALLSDGTLVSWGGYTNPGPLDVPASLAGKHVVAITGGSRIYMALASDGSLTVWSANQGSDTAAVAALPAGLAGADISGFAVDMYYGLALVKKTLEIDAPTLTGAAAEGQTLTGTPGTFSGTPDSIANQWLANGAPIPGATNTTYKLTKAEVGKTISFRSTATTGSDTVDSTSTATTAVKAAAPPPVVRVASRTTITKIANSKHGKKITLTIRVAAAKRPTGRIAIMVKLGKKVAFKGTAKLNAKGIAVLTAKKKALTKRGKYTVTATYAGNGLTKPSKAVRSYKN